MEHKFEPFEKVLVRNSERMWSASFYSHYHKLADKHCTVTGLFSECIEYSGNEHLLGTTDSPEPKHIYKFGEMVEAKNNRGCWERGFYVDTDYKAGLHQVVLQSDRTIYDYTTIRPLKEDK